MVGLKKEYSKAKFRPQIMVLGLRFCPRFYHTYHTGLWRWADKQGRYYSILHSLPSFCFSSPYLLHLHSNENQVYNNETTSRLWFNFLQHVNSITLLSKSLSSEITCTKNPCTLLQKILLINEMQNQHCNWKTSCNVPQHYPLMKRRKLVPPKRERQSSYLKGSAAGLHAVLSPRRLVVEHAASVPWISESEN